MLMGSFCVIGASVIFGICPSIAKRLLLNGLSPMALIFWYSLISTVLNGVSAGISRKRLWGSGRATGKLILVGIVGTGLTSLFLNSSYKYIPVGVATTMHFLYPTLTALAMAVFFKKRLTAARLLAIFLSLAGMFLIAGGKITSSLKGYGLALASAFTYAAYLLAMERGSFDGLGSSARLFWTNLSVTAVFGLLLLAGGGPLAPDWKSASIIFLNGLLMFLAYKMLMLGLSTMGATITAFTSMAEPITSLIVSGILYPQDRITLGNLFGVALILSAMLLASVRRGARKRAENF